MKVILQENVLGLGKIGDQVSVKSGYARNYLLPYQKALRVTPEAMLEFAQRREALEKAEATLLVQAQEVAKGLEGFTLRLTAKVKDERKLFGSIGIKDIVEGFHRAGYDIERRRISLLSGSIRELGEYPVSIRLHHELVITVPVSIEAEK